MRTTPEKDKRETLRPLMVGQTTYTRVLLGRAYDAAYQNGIHDGAVNAFEEGFITANRYGCKAYIACTCKALHDVFGFGAKRMQAVSEAIRYNLLNELEINELVDWCEDKMGIVLIDEATTPPEDE